MHTLIILHVILLIASIALTIGSTGASIFGAHIPKLVNRLNVTFTIVGIGAGIILLLDKPLGVRCAALTAYLMAFTLAQLYIRRRNERFATTPR